MQRLGLKKKLQISLLGLAECKSIICFALFESFLLLVPLIDGLRHGGYAIVNASMTQSRKWKERNDT